jgi:uncharacterized membrane protein YdjX (TVP38/TMEM64 family)
LGTTPDAVAAAAREKRSLVLAIDALRGGARTLVPLPLELPPWLDAMVPEGAVVDPERPVDLSALRRELGGEGEGGAGPRPGRTALAVAALGLLLVVAWRSPWLEAGTPERWAAQLAPWQESAWGPLASVVVFAFAALAMVPVTVLIVASALALGSATGAVTALAGSLTSAAAGYGLGRALWRDRVRRHAGPRLRPLSRLLDRHGMLAIALLRLVPMAPFTIVNLVAGASRVSLRSFLVGTFVGMAPGTLLLALAAEQARLALRDPSPGPLFALGGLAILLVMGGRWLARRIGAEP